MEYIDAYDDSNKFIGSFDRNTIHKKGLWHNTFQCWVVKNTEEKQTLLFQKRHTLKDTFPNLYDTSAAGHLVSGESTREGVRELREELGIEVPFDNLIYLGSMRQIKCWQDYIDKEIYNIFMLNSSCELKKYIVQREEICGLIEVSIDDFKKLIEGKIMSIHAAGFEFDTEENMVEVNINLKYEDFVPHEKEYYSFIINRIKQLSNIW